MNNGFFYAEILNTDRTLNPIKISKKSKILNMPKMAQNGSEWPKLGPNSCYFCIFGLNMTQLNVKSDTQSINQSIYFLLASKKDNELQRVLLKEMTRGRTTLSLHIPSEIFENVAEA